MHLANEDVGLELCEAEGGARDPGRKHLLGVNVRVYVPEFVATVDQGLQGKEQKEQRGNLNVVDPINTRVVKGDHAQQVEDVLRDHVGDQLKLQNVHKDDVGEGVHRKHFLEPKIMKTKQSKAKQSKADMQAIERKQGG